MHPDPYGYLLKYMVAGKIVIYLLVPCSTGTNMLIINFYDNVGMDGCTTRLMTRQPPNHH